MATQTSPQLQKPTSFLPPLSRLSTQTSLQITTALAQLRNLYWPPAPAPLPSRLSLPKRSIKSHSHIHDTSVPDSGYASAEEDDEGDPGFDEEGAVTYITHVSSPSDAVDEGELEIIRADPLEKAFAIKWLTGFICRSDVWVEDEDEREYEKRSQLLDEASSILSAFTAEEEKETEGDDEDDAIIRKFEFATAKGGKIEVELSDAPLLDNDHTSVGLQSWGSSIRFGETICASPERFSLRKPSTSEKPLRVLELGAGTGLLSIAAAKLLQSTNAKDPTIVATDYHPDVLSNLELNVKKNFPNSSCPVQVHALDWSAPFFSAPFDKKFDIIFAADCIYEPLHARWIRSCVEGLLKEGGVFWMIMALRPSGRHEGLEETVMEEFFPAEDGRQLKILEMGEEQKLNGVGRADEAGYRVFRIGWSM